MLWRLLKSFFLWELEYFLGEQEWKFRVPNGYDDFASKFAEMIQLVPKNRPSWPYNAKGGFYGYCNPDGIRLRPFISTGIASMFRFSPVNQFMGRIESEESSVVLAGRYRASLYPRAFILLTSNMLLIIMVWGFIYGIYESFLYRDPETIFVLVLWVPWVFFMLWFIRAAIRMITSHSDYLFPQATARHIRDEIFEILVRLTGDEGRVI